MIPALLVVSFCNSVHTFSAQLPVPSTRYFGVQILVVRFQLRIFFLTGFFLFWRSSNCLAGTQAKKAIEIKENAKKLTDSLWFYHNLQYFSCIWTVVQNSTIILPAGSCQPGNILNRLLRVQNYPRRNWSASIDCGKYVFNNSEHLPNVACIHTYRIWWIITGIWSSWKDQQTTSLQSFSDWKV